MVEQLLAVPVEVECGCGGGPALIEGMIQITRIGRAEVFEAIADLGECLYLDKFKNAVGSYLCVDDGSGICASPELTAAALDLEYRPLIGKLVSVETGHFQFGNSSGFQPSACACLRKETSFSVDRSWSDLFSLAVVDLADRSVTAVRSG